MRNISSLFNIIIIIVINIIIIIVIIIIIIIIDFCCYLWDWAVRNSQDQIYAPKPSQYFFLFESSSSSANQSFKKSTEPLAFACP